MLRFRGAALACLTEMLVFRPAASSASPAISRKPVSPDLSHNSAAFLSITVGRYEVSKDEAAASLV